MINVLEIDYGLFLIRCPFVADEPHGCLQHSTETEKLRLLYDLVSVDFGDNNTSVEYGSDERFCHQVIGQDGIFNEKCCHMDKRDGVMKCKVDLRDFWIQFLNNLIFLLKVVVFLFGPLLFKRYLYTDALLKMDYHVKMPSPVKLKVHFRKVKQTQDHRIYPYFYKSLLGFDGLKNYCKDCNSKTVPWGETRTVKCKDLNIHVDHTRLIDEKSVPVGLGDTLYESIFMCGIRDFGPFRTLCRTSIFGSWYKEDNKFLFIKLKKFHMQHRFMIITWKFVAKLIGGIALVFVIPLPYYIRLIIYYTFERDELQDRAEALQKIGFKVNYEHSVLQYLSPTHPVFILCYVIYSLCFVILTAVQHTNYRRFQKVALEPFFDMGKISKLSGWKMILAHVLLPFEKFGICGILIALPYWAIVLPIAVTIVILYSIPVTYLIVRIIIPDRITSTYSVSNRQSKQKKRGVYEVENGGNVPLVMKEKRAEGDEHQQNWQYTDDKYLSEGASSLESIFKLESISGNHGMDTDVDVKKKFRRRGICSSVEYLGVFFLRLITLALMLAVLLVMSDLFGFIVEVCVFTLMGTIVNAAFAAKYMMLFVWILIYASTCYNHVYHQYATMNKSVFEMFKEKMKDEITKVTRLAEKDQKNTAFHYFKAGEVEGEQPTDSANSDRYHVDPFGQKSFHWTLNDAVLFVDRKDKPRIPLKLFHMISKIKAPGCPGSVFMSQLAATRRFLYMVVFLLFVLIVIMSFGNIYSISTTNQMLATLAGGFIPFVLTSVLKPKGTEVKLNTYSFDGKIHEIIREYKEDWPINDLEFEIDNSGTSSGPGTDNDDSDNNKSDLVIDNNVKPSGPHNNVKPSGAGTDKDDSDNDKSDLVIDNNVKPSGPDNNVKPSVAGTDKDDSDNDKSDLVIDNNVKPSGPVTDDDEIDLVITVVSKDCENDDKKRSPRSRHELFLYRSRLYLLQ